MKAFRVYSTYAMHSTQSDDPYTYISGGRHIGVRTMRSCAHTTQGPRTPMAWSLMRDGTHMLAYNTCMHPRPIPVPSSPQHCSMCVKPRGHPDYIRTNSHLLMQS